mmetsp:Transcript_199/g.437  ORF Transcript_199/g.437 Transcript_199/m.437 type:complete len:258 (-) Transcript_199:947-1720(-)
MVQILNFLTFLAAALTERFVHIRPGWRRGSPDHLHFNCAPRRVVGHRGTVRSVVLLRVLPLLGSCMVDGTADAEVFRAGALKDSINVALDHCQLLLGQLLLLQILLEKAVPREGSGCGTLRGIKVQHPPQQVCQLRVFYVRSQSDRPCDLRELGTLRESKLHSCVLDEVLVEFVSPEVAFPDQFHRNLRSEHALNHVKLCDFVFEIKKLFAGKDFEHAATQSPHVRRCGITRLQNCFRCSVLFRANHVWVRVTPEYC